MKAKGFSQGQTPPVWQETPRCPACQRWLFRTPAHDPPDTPLDKRRLEMVWFCGRCQKEVPEHKIPWPTDLPRPQEVIDALGNYLALAPAPLPDLERMLQRLEFLPTVQRVR
ncbi:MAG: hypothetical protein NZ602_17165, partial [Thermoguttaceae bacterium]|nr:hypothetical protein [Thermoguttaceae bacterium]